MAFYILVYVGVEVTIGGASRYREASILDTKECDRLDCNILNSRTRWRVIVWICFIWFLWRLVTTKAQPWDWHSESRAGLTLGRVVLLWVNRKVGEKRVVFIYAALAIGWVYHSQILLAYASRL